MIAGGESDEISTDLLHSTASCACFCACNNDNDFYHEAVMMNVANRMKDRKKEV